VPGSGLSADVRVAVCRKCKGHDAIVEALRAGTDAEVELVRCQKICHGPVVGVALDGRYEWVEKVGKPKRVRALLQLVRSGRRADITEKLQVRRVAKHSGTKPR